jgi:RES domain-containing protein
LNAPATLWRISNHGDLAGLGGEMTNGRWHTAVRGKRVVYLSEHPAVALIEALANLKGNPELFPDSFQLLKIVVAEGLSAAALPAGSLPEQWRGNPAETRRAGDAWLAAGQSALMAVPSAPAPESLNYLFNPLHRDAAGIRIEWCKRVDYDRRLFTIRDILPAEGARLHGKKESVRLPAGTSKPLRPLRPR